jgi:hypothetical protein
MSFRYLYNMLVVNICYRVSCTLVKSMHFKWSCLVRGTGCVLRPGKAMPNNMYLSTLPTIRYAVEFYSVIHNISEKHVNMFRWKLKFLAVFYLTNGITAHLELISRFSIVFLIVSIALLISVNSLVSNFHITTKVSDRAGTRRMCLTHKNSAYI